MARLFIDPAEIKKHPKFHAFRKKLDWQPHHALGFLCAFWGEVLNTDANESGEISDWTPDYIADRIGVRSGFSPDRLWEAFVECGYVSVRPDGRILVTDWMQIAGEALERKYHSSDPIFLGNVYALHGQIRPRGKQKSAPDSPHVNLEETFRQPKGNLEETGEIPTDINTPSSKKKFSKENDNDKSVFSSPSWETEGEEKTATHSVAVSDKPNPAVKILQKAYYEKLAGRLGEKPVGFNWGEAGKIFKEMLDQNLGIQHIESRFDPWFASTESFIVRRGFRVRDFPGFFNTLKDGPIANQVGSNARETFDDGAATVHEEAGARF